VSSFELPCVSPFNDGDHDQQFDERESRSFIHDRFLTTGFNGNERKQCNLGGTVTAQGWPQWMRSLKGG